MEQLIIGRPSRENVICFVSERATNYFHPQRLCCSESVLQAFNEIFGGGLSLEQSVNIASVLCGGMGGAGCVCGALAGAALSLGLLIGPRHPGGLSTREIRELTVKLHDRFRARFSSVCCRDLTAAVKDNQQAKFKQCQGIVSESATMAAVLLLAARPDFVGRADMRII